MHFHLRDHIYVTLFREELILLDVKQDKYTICFKQLSDLLLALIKQNTPGPKAPMTADVSNTLSSSQELAYVQRLLEDGIIEKQASPFPFIIDCKPDSEGVSNVDWRLPLENKKIHFNIQVLNALIILIKVNLYMKFKGFYSAIQLIKRSRNIQESYLIPQDEELRNLANIVNKACLVYPSRTKCLEWAMTFVLLALKRKWKCNLEIGVQNYPFFAHAWVECNGKVVMDSQNLRKGLGIILNEPFRRVTI